LAALISGRRKANFVARFAAAGAAGEGLMAKKRSHLEEGVSGRRLRNGEWGGHTLRLYLLRALSECIKGGRGERCVQRGRA